MEVGFLALDGLEEELVDQDGLEGDSNNLDDAVDYMDAAWNGMIGAEDTNGDGETAVDENKKDTEIQKKQVDRVLRSSFSLSQFLDPEESHHRRQESEKVDAGVENLPQILEGCVLLAGVVAQEHDEVHQGEKEDEAAGHGACSGLGPVGLGQGGAEVGSGQAWGAGGRRAGDLPHLLPAQAVDVGPGVVEEGPAHQGELHDEGVEEGRARLQNIRYKVVVVIFLSALSQCYALLFRCVVFHVIVFHSEFHVGVIS